MFVGSAAGQQRRAQQQRQGACQPRSWVLRLSHAPQELQRGGSAGRSSSDRVPVSLPRLAEALCGDASPAAVLAALRALASDRTYFKQARCGTLSAAASLPL